MKMKISKHLIIAWLMCMIALMVDMYTTVIGIRLGAEEATFIPAFLFTLGDMGYFYALIFGGILFFVGLFFLINFCSWLYKKMVKKKMSNNFRIFLYYLFAGIFVLLEVWTVWHNLKIIAILGG